MPSTLRFVASGLGTNDRCAMDRAGLAADSAIDLHVGHGPASVIQKKKGDRDDVHTHDGPIGSDMSGSVGWGDGLQR